jgi:parvulin-like peptidyl-prolyl isomerase
MRVRGVCRIQGACRIRAIAERLTCVLLSTVLGIAAPQVVSGEQALATVGGVAITTAELESTVASSPIGAQFPAMDEQLQARIRGELLRRLINAELLHLEARKEGVDQSPEFQRQMNSYRGGLLSQRYFARLRDEIVVPAEVDAEMRERFRGDGEALAAARSSYISTQYKPAREQRLEELADVSGLKLRLARLDSDDPNTLLAEGDGVAIRLGDLVYDGESLPPAGLEVRRRRLEDVTSMALAAHAAEMDGIRVDDLLDDYRRRLLAELLLTRKEHEWVPDEEAMREYYEKHPEIGLIPEQREVGQIVVASREEAEALRQRILSGESLFELAKTHSIDPYGREHAGYMGWMKAGTGFPALESVMQSLAEDEISPVVKTQKGYHLVLILRRKPARQQPFIAITDRVHQAMVQSHLPDYMASLADKYPVEVLLPDH